MSIATAAIRRVASANYLRTALLLGALTVLVVLVADWLGGTGWAVGALVFMGLANFASWYWSDRIVIAIHRARLLTAGEAPQVHRAVQRLARAAGIPVPTIYYVPDPAPNAFATGRNPEHAVVAVTDGLLRLLDERELEGVIAHELSHVLNRDILISTIAATLAGAVSLVARVAGFGLMFGGGRDDRDQGGGALGGILMIIVAPIIALIIQLAVSRSREYGADATGARLAGTPEGLVAALKKLHFANQRIPMVTADPATAHLYIIKPRSLMGIFSTHPPIEERIARLEALG
jgi:heat shock protein HtpX